MIKGPRQQSSNKSILSVSDPHARHAGIARINLGAQEDIPTERSFDANYVSGRLKQASTGEDPNGVTFDETYGIKALPKPNYTDDDAYLIGRAALEETTSKVDKVDAKTSGPKSYQRREKSKVPTDTVKGQDTQPFRNVPFVRTEI